MISKLKFIYLLHHGHYKIHCSRYLQDPSKHSNRTNPCKTIRQPFSRVNSHKYSLFDPWFICEKQRQSHFLTCSSSHSRPVECFFFLFHCFPISFLYSINTTSTVLAFLQWLYLSLLVFMLCTFSILMYPLLLGPPERACSICKEVK